MFDNQALAGFLGAIGLLTLIGLFWFTFIVVLVWRERKASPLLGIRATKLVLKRFIVNESGAPAVEVIGRLPGLLGWTLQILKLEPEVRFTLSDSEASFQASSLSGTRHTYIPLEKVSSTTCGYRRSIPALAISVFCVFPFAWCVLAFTGLMVESRDANASGPFAAGAIAWFGISAIAAAWFLLSKRIAIVIRAGEEGFGFLFKRSVIENVSIELREALRAIAAINVRVLAAQHGTAPVASSYAAAGNTARRCPKCSSTNPSSIKFCENCGFSLA